ncbi:MAG TPA: hypothetical protein VGO37_00445 [Steroidobacteraceae bacterium]|jgi:hypothetical protein|nr:hypothetical protein [Steroidobacteraceae bacterium]
MRSPVKAALILSCVALLLAGSALGGAGIAAKIANDSTDDILVTVYDRSMSVQQIVLTNERVNGFASVPITLVGDGTGKAQVSWTATSIDSVKGRCGHGDAVLSNGGTVNVHADSSCSGV